MTMNLWALEFFLFGSLLIMAIYHFGLFLLRTQDRITFYWGAFCLLNAWHIMISADVFLILLNLTLSPEIALGIKRISLCWALTLFVLFTERLYPDESWVGLSRLAIGLAVVLTLTLLLLPFKYYPSFMPLYSMVYLAGSFYVGSIFTLAWRRKRNGALWGLIGGLALCASLINDFLYENHWLDTNVLFPVGFFMFIFSHSFILALRFSHTFQSIESLSTELSLKNEALSKVDQLKDEFLANTSHELKTPLHGMIGLVESLKDGVSDSTLSARVQHQLTMILSSSIRLSKLVDDLLDFSKLKNNELPLQLRSVDLGSVASFVLLLSHPLIGEKEIQLVNHIPESLPLVLADENRLEQILQNLLGNAIKFTHQGTVTVSAESIGKTIHVHVSDTGIGIADNQQETIFKMFQQGDSSISREYGGTGLGLSISRHIVALLGGTLTVQSQLGQGSIFSFTIPIAENQNLEVREIQRTISRLETSPSVSWTLHDSVVTPHENDPERPLVLVVDDEPLNLAIVTGHLQTRGFHVQTAKDGYEALEFMEEETPELILMDLMMPRLNGFEVCRIIRETHDLTALPIIMLTAKSHVSDLVEALASGANDYLTKPFHKEELLSRVKLHLQVKENAGLREEIVRRQHTEQQLRRVHRRLIRMLDIAEDPILALNHRWEFIFFNQGAQALFKYAYHEVLGQPMEFLISIDAEQLEKKNILVPYPTEWLSLTGHIKGGRRCPLEASVFKLEQETAFALLVREKVVWSQEPENRAEPSKTTSDRLRLLGHSVETLLRELQSLDIDAQEISQFLKADTPLESRRVLLVRVMQMTLAYWEQTTQKTKVDLAEASGLWRAYLDKGSYKTRTLDKYLTLDTLPKNPHWKNVVRTAEFVLKQPSQDVPLKQDLENHVTRLQTLMLQ